MENKKIVCIFAENKMKMINDKEDIIIDVNDEYNRIGENLTEISYFIKSNDFDEMTDEYKMKVIKMYDFMNYYRDSLDEFFKLMVNN